MKKLSWNANKNAKEKSIWNQMIFNGLLVGWYSEWDNPEIIPGHIKHNFSIMFFGYLSVYFLLNLQDSLFILAYQLAAHTILAGSFSSEEANSLLRAPSLFFKFLAVALRVGEAIYYNLLAKRL